MNPLLAPIIPAPRAVIFDLDGTLGDTFSLVVEAFNAGSRDLIGRDYSTSEVIAMFGIPDASMIKNELLRLGRSLGEADEAVDRYHAAYEAKHRMAKVFDGITPVLHALRDRGMPMGVMTGKGRRSADITVRAFGWEGLFGAVITGDDVVNQKPAPDGVLEVARLLNVEPTRCVFVGDSPADINAGKAAGMKTIVAGWHPVYLDQLRPLQPDRWANDPADLLKIVLP